jgi:hypothetical protein
MSSLYSFDLKVVVKTRPNLRDNEMTSMMGFSFLEKLFDSIDILDNEKIYLEYPERWLNILEQRVLFDACAKRCPKLKELTVLTHSVYIIQTTPNTCAGIVDKTTDYPDISYDIGVRYCPPIGPDPGLQVFYGGK